MRASVVIPTLDARELLRATLASLARQTLSAEIVVVDNGSTDGTLELLEHDFPDVAVVRNGENLGFGRAINRAALGLDSDALVLLNNDVVCEPELLERLCAALELERVGMAAGVLLQARSPGRIDSAGIELDVSLQSYDYLWNEPVDRLAATPPDPVGPCGGAAAYRLDVFRRLGGFDEAFFAYWEDVDLALRFRLEGWRCVLVPDARALHFHGATLGAASPTQRRLEAFGRGYTLAKYGVVHGPRRLVAAVLDWPVLLTHLLVRRELGPIRERRRGLREGRRARRLRAPVELATIGFGEAVARQLRVLKLRASGRLPEYLDDAGPAR